MKKRRLIILARKGVSTNILYHSLKDEYDIEAVLLEDPVPRKDFLKKRIKKSGIWNVFGQILFQVFIATYLKVTSSHRKKEILNYYGLDSGPLPSQKVIHLESVNDSACMDLLQKIKPELIIVNGTRVISKEVLNSINVRFINIHAGITPRYRNVHGAYWALVQNDISNCGVTVHEVDAGIDTGKIIYQHPIIITEKDNFCTYPVLQLAEGILCLKKALSDIFENTLIYKKNDLDTKLWYHPTIWQYIYYRVVHNIK